MGATVHILGVKYHSQSDLSVSVSFHQPFIGDGFYQQKLGDVGDGGEDYRGQNVACQGKEGSPVVPGPVVHREGDTEEVEQPGRQQDVHQREEVGHQVGKHLLAVLSGELGCTEHQPGADLTINVIIIVINNSRMVGW